jgi:hypothetical protein
MARVWTTPLDSGLIEDDSRKVVSEACQLSDRLPPWIEGCEETENYVNSWFAPEQRIALSKLARTLARRAGPTADAMRIAFSRIIVTKERGASIARDTSHSRPHRVFFDNDFDVISGFLRSASLVANRLNPGRLRGLAVVNVGDARSMKHLPDHTVDAVITSPPYLNAIDYIRGHRLALVWLGFTLKDLRVVRSASIGTEVSRPRQSPIDPETLLSDAVNLTALPSRDQHCGSRGIAVAVSLDREPRYSPPGGRSTALLDHGCNSPR